MDAVIVDSGDVSFVQVVPAMYMVLGNPESAFETMQGASSIATIPSGHTCGSLCTTTATTT